MLGWGWKRSQGEDEESRQGRGSCFRLGSFLTDESTAPEGLRPLDPRKRGATGLSRPYACRSLGSGALFPYLSPVPIWRQSDSDRGYAPGYYWSLALAGAVG